MFSIFKKNQPGILLSLFLNFCQISGSRSFKIVFIKKSENSVRFAIPFSIYILMQHSKHFYSDIPMKVYLNLKSAQ